MIVDAPPARLAPPVASIPATVSEGGRYAAVVFFLRSPGGGGTDDVVVPPVVLAAAEAATMAWRMGDSSE